MPQKRKKRRRNKKYRPKAKYHHSTAWCRVGALVQLRPHFEVKPPAEWVFDPGIFVWDSLEQFTHLLREGVGALGEKRSKHFDEPCVVVDKTIVRGKYSLVKVMTADRIFWVQFRDLARYRKKKKDDV